MSILHFQLYGWELLQDITGWLLEYNEQENSVGSDTAEDKWMIENETK